MSLELQRALRSAVFQVPCVIGPSCVFCGLLSWSVQCPFAEHPIHMVESKKFSSTVHFENKREELLLYPQDQTSHYETLFPSYLLSNANVNVPNHEQEVSIEEAALRAGDSSPSRVHQGHQTVSGSDPLIVLKVCAVATTRSAQS